MFVTIMCVVSLSREFVFHLLALNQSFVHHTFVFDPMVVAIGLMDHEAVLFQPKSSCVDTSLGAFGFLG